MKLIDDNFDDYFESGAPKKDKAPHQETEEEREERELIETTIERRSNKKRIFLALGTLIVLLILIFVIRDRYFRVYQESNIKGRIADVSLRGSIFKTYEGKLLSYDVVSEGNVREKEFEFTVGDDSLAHTLGTLKQTPIAVQLNYKEYKSSVPWRGETKYIVTSVDTVNIDAYVRNVERMPVPKAPQQGDTVK